jgi:hypothetical protein
MRFLRQFMCLQGQYPRSSGVFTREVQVVARGSSAVLTRQLKKNLSMVRDSKQFRCSSAGSSATLLW